MIQRLKLLSNEIRLSIPKMHRHIDNHYVLECKNQEVMVFTRHPQEDSFVVSNQTILGKGGPQYLNKVIYKIDSSNAHLIPAPETKDFETKNMAVLLKAKEDSSGYKIIELAKLITDK
ncbi:MAG: hypothetical protein EOP34_09625 [Rickettsiales bacterium]|nr:MAG: hypothetical protein EOP34_09625 [Rickettsiales bacterium]